MFSLLLTIPSPAKGKESALPVVEAFTGEVVAVADGDTITVLYNVVGVSPLDSTLITR